MDRIITHSGGAHFDEFAAISLIVAVFPGLDFSIERRDPTAEELEDPEVWVVDVGGRLEPEKRNFDHHQSLECPASFVLVAEYLALLETMSVLSWWDFKDYLDRFGPAKASEKYGAGDWLVSRSPLESWMLSSFASSPQSALPMMRSFGSNIIGEARRLKGQVDLLRASDRLTIAGIPAIIAETQNSLGLEEFRRLDPNPPDIVISVDAEGGGWRLFRFEGAPVDFSRISDSPEVAFAHKSGFLAKTRERIPMSDLVRLVSKAVINGNR